MKKKIVFIICLLMIAFCGYSVSFETERQAPLYQYDGSQFIKSGNVLTEGITVEITEIIELTEKHYYGNSTDGWIYFGDLKSKEIEASAAQKVGTLYSTHSENSEVIKKYDAPISFSVLEEKIVEYYQWHRVVTFDGIEGWTRVPYDSVYAEPVKLADSKMLYSNFTENSNLIDTLEAETYVFPYEQHGRWVRVSTFDNIGGWIESPALFNFFEAVQETQLFSEYRNQDMFTVLPPGTRFKPVEKVDYSVFRVEYNNEKSGYVNIETIRAWDPDRPVAVADDSVTTENSAEPSVDDEPTNTFSPEEAVAVAGSLKKERIIINDCKLYSESNRYSEPIMDITAPAEFKLIKNRQYLGVHWYHVKIDGTRGWILGENVKPSTYDKATAIEGPVYFARNGEIKEIDPGIENYPRNGLPVTILEKEPGSLQVLFENGVNGWVLDENVRLKGEYPESVFIPLYTISRALFGLFNYNILGLILIIAIYIGVPFFVLIFLTAIIGNLEFIWNIFLKIIAIAMGVLSWVALAFTYKAVISYHLSEPAVVVPIIIYILGFIFYATCVYYMISRYRCPKCRYWAGNIIGKKHTGSTFSIRTTTYSS